MKANDWNWNTYKHKGVSYSDNIITFDIEVSSGFIKNGKMYNDINVLSDSWFDDAIPVALPYIWQAGFDDDVYYERNFEDVKSFFTCVNASGHKSICYVHFLGYEYQFLLNLFTPSKVFARQSHHPIYVEFEELPNIQFRCSYMLTRLPLAKWAESVGSFKADGDLNYNVLRTPFTRLTKKELFYCEQDIKAMVAGLRTYLKRYGHIKDIPLTQTGTVRREVKKLLSDYKHLKYVSKLFPTTVKSYEDMLKTYRGGDTHANFLYVGHIFKQPVWGYDFASSYPYTMCAEKFPCTPFIRVPQFIPDFINDYAYIIKLAMDNVEPITFNHYLSRSKCEELGASNSFTLDNGRIMTASHLVTYVTEYDYEIIKKTYKADFTELEVYRAKKGYLPKKFIEYILELYGNKTSLKNVEGKEELYAQSKQYINALYGMMCSSVIYDSWETDGNEWVKHEVTKDDVQTELDKIRARPSKKRFVSFYWGLYVSALARYHLWQNIIEHDENVIYYDTDSIKTHVQIDTSAYNTECDKKLAKMCEHYNIDFALTRPKDPDGVEHPLGYFENDALYDEFVTLGAKRYAYKKHGHDDIDITIAGVPKNAKVALTQLSDFKDGFVFPRTLEGKNEASKQMYYLTDIGKVTWNKGKYDEYESTFNYGIASRRKCYTLGLTEDFIRAVEYIQSINGLRCMEGVGKH